MISVQADLFSKLLMNAKKLREDVQLVVLEDSISIICADIANVIMFHGKIPCQSNGEEYGFWVSLSRICRAISRLNGEIVINRLPVESITGDDHYELVFLNDGLEIRVREINPIKSRYIPDIFYSMRMTLTRKQISDFCSVVEDLGGSKIRLLGYGVNKTLKLEFSDDLGGASKDIIPGSFEYHPEYATKSGKILTYEETQATIYSLDYLKRGLSAFSPKDILQVWFTDDHPIRFGIWNDELTYEFYLAPRIEA